MSVHAGLRKPCSIVLLCLTSALACAAAVAAPADTAAPEEYRRGEDQTYLAYPERFLVHSPAEYARFVATEQPSEFPFFGHIAQFWNAYRTMTNAMGERYELNFGYHVMVFVIGTSTTVEYALKAGYEAAFGRWFEVDAMTPEDEFAAYVAQDYVDFILARPWYEYPFYDRLSALWRDTPMWGPHVLRKWERRFALTTEYAVKAGYAVLIEKMTRAGYEAPLPVTSVLLASEPPTLAELSDLEELSTMADGSHLITVPRYAMFKTYALALANGGADFVEIAGDRGIIVLSLLVDVDWAGTDVPHDLLMEQQILTEPNHKRQVLRVEIGQLARLLRELGGTDVTIEHVYDF